MSYVPLIALAFLLIVGGALLEAALTHRQGELTVAFLDVGQGDAIFIQSPSGTQIVIDGGPDGAILQELSRVMPLWDRSIDAIVITNPDQDHFAGFIDVLKRYDVAQVYEPGVTKDSSMYATLEREMAEEGAARVNPKRGQTIDLGGGAHVRVLFPDRDVSRLDSNPGSLVMRLVYGDTSVMLMGDSVEGVEDFIVDLGSNAPASRYQSQLLKLGHHGSRTSSGEKLLDAVAPNVAIVSAGCDNSYGHPHKEVLERLAARSIPYLWTCKEGTIEFASDGQTWRRE